MKKWNIALIAVIALICLGLQIVLKYIYGLTISAGLSIFIGVFIGIAAAVGYGYAQIETFVSENDADIFKKH